MLESASIVVQAIRIDGVIKGSTNQIESKWQFITIGMSFLDPDTNNANKDERSDKQWMCNRRRMRDTSSVMYLSIKCATKFVFHDKYGRSTLIECCKCSLRLISHSKPKFFVNYSNSVKSSIRILMYLRGFTSYYIRKWFYNVCPSFTFANPQQKYL